MIEGMLLLARTEGIFTETAGGVTVAVTKKLIETGVIPRGESVVISITGNGLKTPDALYERLEAHVKISPRCPPSIARWPISRTRRADMVVRAAGRRGAGAPPS